MGLYRHNLSLRLSPAGRASDKLDLLLERFPEASPGVTGCVVRDGPAVAEAVRRLARAGWAARGMFPDEAVQNRQVLAWAKNAERAAVVLTPALAAGLADHSAAEAAGGWRALWLLAWPPALADFPPLWERVGADGLAANVEIVPAAADLDAHARDLAAPWPAGRLLRLRQLRPRAEMEARFGTRHRLFLRQLLTAAFSEADPEAGPETDSPERNLAGTDLRLAESPGLMDGAPFFLDRLAAERATGASSGRIARAAEFLLSEGWWERLPESPALAAWRERGRAELARTVSWLESSACRWRGLLERLGQPSRPPCGQCDWCRGKRTAWLAASQ